MQAKTESDGAFSQDGFLGNRLVIRQPRRGHRSGHDAVLLAASVGDEKTQSVCDLGAGAGVVGLCILARLPKAQLIGVEIDPDLCNLARKNAATNGFTERAQFVSGDITGPFSELGLKSNSFDHVVANPPFIRATGPHRAGCCAHARIKQMRRVWKIGCGVPVRWRWAMALSLLFTAPKHWMICCRPCAAGWVL